MIIKKYIDFINESINGYSYGCVMIEVPVKNWEELVQVIDIDDIYEEKGDSTYSIQKNPHLTLLYGLHENVTDDQVKKVFDNFNEEINIEIDGIDIFENPKFDVVKFNVKKTDTLQKLFDKLSELPNSNEYPDYKPHITIGYVKSGTGKKYVNPNYKHKVSNVNEIIYSKPNDDKFKFHLNRDLKIESIFETFEYKTSDGQILKYDAEWKIPGSSTREMLENDLRDILLELEDLGYRIQLCGFIKGPFGFTRPCVWIKNKMGQTLNKDEIEDYVVRVEDYLQINGFETERTILNEGKISEQLYIYFDKKD